METNIDPSEWFLDTKTSEWVHEPKDNSSSGDVKIKENEQQETNKRLYRESKNYIITKGVTILKTEIKKCTRICISRDCLYFECDGKQQSVISVCSGANAGILFTIKRAIDSWILDNDV